MSYGMLKLRERRFLGSLPAEAEEAIPPREQDGNLLQLAQWAGAALAILVVLRLFWPTVRRYRTTLATRRVEQRRRYEASFDI
jgi:hypothetical protein